MEEFVKLTADSVVVAATDQLSSDLPDETIVLSLPRGMYFGVNAVAREIWQLVQEPRSVREIRDVIAARYGADSADVERDLITFLGELESNQLLTVQQS